MSKAAQWANNTVDFKFPVSGKEVVLRPLTGYVLLKSDAVPDTLTPIVADVINGNPDQEQRKKNLEAVNTLRGTQDFYQLTDWIIQYMFVDPKVVDNPTADDEISFADIEDSDRHWLINLIGKGARELELFRKVEAEIMERMDAPEGTSPTSE